MQQKKITYVQRKSVFVTDRDAAGFIGSINYFNKNNRPYPNYLFFDSELISCSLPNYYFNQFDPRSPFYGPFPDSDDWHASFTDPGTHHSTDPFDSN